MSFLQIVLLLYFSERNTHSFCIPLRIAAVGAADCEVFATAERLITNACNAVRDNDACEVFATVKRAITNACNAVGDSDAFEVFATVERPIINVCNAVGDSVAGSVVASGIFYEHSFILVKQHAEFIA